ncbi:hypothetical protein PILCRDRAFT_269618 [Piloderma croceum F 1598]|uniref:RRM domain-containing protein n=1 Tax=Piloderma croceum (strain F 1598) TaxID=765440 RepID=A0A0C3G8J1_PILCF|nr:hypothetical protein PILCRDRAFT_269618 [Piloderma croceum F 1598]
MERGPPSHRKHNANLVRKAFQRLLLRKRSQPLSRLQLLPLHSASSSMPDLRRKRLVVIGISKDDSSAIRALTDWCKTQGPVEEFCVRPDGSFHIEFRVNEIADEACCQFYGYNIAGRNMTAVQCSTIIWSPLDDIRGVYQGQP